MKRKLGNTIFWLYIISFFVVPLFKAYFWIFKKVVEVALKAIKWVSNEVRYGQFKNKKGY